MVIEIDAQESTTHFPWIILNNHFGYILMRNQVNFIQLEAQGLKAM